MEGGPAGSQQGLRRPEVRFYCLRTREVHSVHPALVQLRPRLLQEFERAQADAAARQGQTRAQLERVWAAAAEMQQEVMRDAGGGVRGG